MFKWIVFFNFSWSLEISPPKFQWSFLLSAKRWTVSMFFVKKPYVIILACWVKEFVFCRLERATVTAAALYLHPIFCYCINPTKLTLRFFFYSFDHRTFHIRSQFCVLLRLYCLNSHRKRILLWSRINYWLFLGHYLLVQSLLQLESEFQISYHPKLLFNIN